MDKLTTGERELREAIAKVRLYIDDRSLWVDTDAIRIVCDAAARAGERVPREPTPEMLAAVRGFENGWATTVWKFMYDAAPIAQPAEPAKWEQAANDWFRAHVEGLDRCKRLRDALKRLTLAARTSGGTAGRDEELCAACDQAESALTAPAAQPVAQPVAWRWRPKGGEIWFYDPTLEWLEMQGDAIEKRVVGDSSPLPPHSAGSNKP